MKSEQCFFFMPADNPGSGGGIAGNSPAREMEKRAAEKVAGDPGSVAHAAGIAGDPDSNDNEDAGLQPDPEKNDAGQSD